MKTMICMLMLLTVTACAGSGERSASATPTAPQTPLGTYQGAATIIGLVGPVVSGCHPLYGRLPMTLMFTVSGPVDGGTVTVENADPSNYVFRSLHTDLGGSSPPEAEDRIYSLIFTSDLSTATARIASTLNAQATYRSGCSGYTFEVVFTRQP